MKGLVFNKPKLLAKHLKVILGQWMIICKKKKKLSLWGWLISDNLMVM